MMRGYTDKKDNILLFLMGMFVFSSLSSEITLRFMHLPLAMPELLLCPFLFLLRHKFKSISLSKVTFVKSCFILIFLVLVALLVGRFTVTSIISNARVWFYLFLFFSLFKKPNKVSIDDMMYISLGSLCGWAVVCLTNFKLLSIALDDASIAIYGPMLCIPVFFVIALHRKHYKLVFLGSVFLLIILLLSGLRRAMLISFATFALYAIIVSIIGKKRIIHTIGILSIVMIIASLILPILGDIIKDISYDLYHRVFVRTEQLFTEGFGKTGDDIRINNFTQLFNNLEKYTLSHGLISHQTDKYLDVGVFNDFPLVQLCWIFGWPITLVILFYFLHILLNNYNHFTKKTDTEYLLSTITLACMFILLFLEGTFLLYAYATPITGLLLAKSTCLSNIRAHRYG